MKRILLLIGFAFIGMQINAQVGINTTTPDPSSALDVTSNDKGVLLPRVTLNSYTQQLSTVTNAVSLLVYNIGSTNVPKGFYVWDGTTWIQLVDETKLKSSSYWIPQGTTGTFTAPNSGSQGASSNFGPGSTTNVPGVNIDIYQKGKVGIGYNSSADINFATAISQKQLEVGGDIRAVYKDVANNRYYGIETNTNGLPNTLSGSGNVFFNAKTKNAGDFDDFTKVFDGTGIFQNHQFMWLGSRTGTSAANLSMSFVNVTPYSISDLVTDNTNSRTVSLGMTGYNVGNSGISSDYSFGIQFPFSTSYNTHNFYIGDHHSSGNGYFFPNTAGTNKQILQLEADANGVIAKNKLVWKNSLDVITPGTENGQVLTTEVIPANGSTPATTQVVWKNPTDNGGSSAPKFFYMPSVILPTVSGDALIGTGSTANYTYDTTTQTFSVKIYNLFSNQFTTPVAVSSTGTNLTEFVKTADKYDYFVTHADASVFTNITIDANGVLNYKINPTAIIKSGSFMNVVLKVK